MNKDVPQAQSPIIESENNKKFHKKLNNKKGRLKTKNHIVADNNRKEIKISLVEGITFNSSGKDFSPEELNNIKYLELNYRKRPGSNTGKDNSTNSYQYDEKDSWESDYVAKLIEQAAAASGINYNMNKSYHEKSPIRRRITENTKSHEDITHKSNGDFATISSGKGKITFQERNFGVKSKSFINQEDPNRNNSNKNQSFWGDSENSFSYRMNGRSLFQNVSIDSKLEVDEKKPSPKKKTKEFSFHQDSKKKDGNRGLILSGMNFNLSTSHHEYQDREQEGLKAENKVPIIANLSQNKWSHLPKVDVEIPRTHKQLTSYEPSRVNSSALKSRKDSKSKKVRGIFYLNKFSSLN